MPLITTSPTMREKSKTSDFAQLAISHFVNISIFKVVMEHILYDFSEDTMPEVGNISLLQRTAISIQGWLDKRM